MVLIDINSYTYFSYGNHFWMIEVKQINIDGPLFCCCNGMETTKKRVCCKRKKDIREPKRCMTDTGNTVGWSPFKWVMSLLGALIKGIVKS